MTSGHRRSTMRAVVLILVLALTAGMVAGCGGGDQFTGSWGNGMLKIKKDGDTYSVNDTVAPFEKEYTGTVEDGVLVAETQLVTYTFTVDGDWLVQEASTGMEIRYEKDW